MALTRDMCDRTVRRQCYAAVLNVNYQSELEYLIVQNTHEIAQAIYLGLS